MVMFGVFVGTMKAEYRRSFVSTESGCEYVVNIFERELEDEGKAYLFEYHRGKWERIRGKVRKWVEESWGMWSDTRPEWFNEGFKRRVPKEWKPKEWEEEELEDEDWGEGGSEGGDDGNMDKDGVVKVVVKRKSARKTRTRRWSMTKTTVGSY